MGKYTIEKRKLYEEVKEQILKLIGNGEYMVGDRLPSLLELSEMFAIGKPTLREALSVLSSNGILEIRHGSGIFVKRLGEPDQENPIYLGEVESNNLLSWLEFRKSIEVSTAGLAAQRRTEEDLLSIEEAIRNMEQEIASGRIGAAWDYQFHERIALASHNSIYAQVIRTTEHILKHYFESNLQQTLAMPLRRNLVAVEHRDILGCIRKGLFSEAQEAMMRHLMNVEKKVKSSRDIKRTEEADLPS